MEERVAVVGIGCRYPGANGPLEFFENLLAGRRAFRRIPAERWALEDYYDREGGGTDTITTCLAAVLEDFGFNHADFKILRRTYEATDLAHWLALQAALEAYQDCRVQDIPRNATAVILGNTLAGETSRAQMLRYRWPYARRVFDELLQGLHLPEEARAAIMQQVEVRYKSPFPPVTEDSLAGSLANTIAGRVCNYFDFHGGGYTIDGACSSSLLAIAQACSQLVAGDLDMAFAGGVDISLDPFELVGFSRVGVLSDDDMRVYDQRSRGFFPGEGCGIVALKRLGDARAQGDRIYAVIQGWGYSSDGRGGLTTPSVEGQALALRRAYERAGYTLNEVDLLEGHGTGTTVGDLTELSAITACMQRHGVDPAHRCALGSVKSNIGHTKAAAGVAGFIKATLSVYYGLMPPTRGVQVPNKVFETNPNLYPLRKGRVWGERPKRRGGVSSAGFGGINVHVTMEASGQEGPRSPEAQRLAALLSSAQDSEVVLLSAEHAEDMLRALQVLRDAAHRISFAQLSDLAAHCARRARHGRLRAAFVASSPAVLAGQLGRLAELLQQTSAEHLNYTSLEEGIYYGSDLQRPRVAFLFPGQGSQRLNMGDVWRDRFPFLRDFWEQCDGDLEDLLPSPLSRFVFKDTDQERSALQEAWKQALADTAIAQPAITAASMATAKLLRYFGIEPDLALGHSLGEYAALWSAGVLSTTATLRLVAQRGRAMAQPAGEAGTMLSIAAPAARVASLLHDVLGYATLANYNAPDQTVVSGERRAIEQLKELCDYQGLHATLLPVSNAFHSRLMLPAQEVMQAILRETRFKPFQHLVVSGVTGTFIPDGADLAGLLTHQITAPVRFHDALQACLEEVDLVIEVGPRAVLCRLAQRVQGDQHFVVATDASVATEDPFLSVHHVLAYAFVRGLPVRTERVFENRFVREIQLPYQPHFIASPCETRVEPLRLSLNVRLDDPPGSDGASGALPGPAVPHREADPPADAAADPGGGGRWDKDRIFVILQCYIAKEFGYPPALVQPSARLSEDLNLDSIKSAELVAEALAQLGLAHEDPSALLVGAETLEDLAARLEQQHRGADQPNSEEKPRTAGAHQDLPGWVRTFETRMEAAAAPSDGFTWPEGPVVLVAPEPSPLLAALEALLAARGIACLTQVGEEVAFPDVVPAGCIILAPQQVTDGLAGGWEAGMLRFPRMLLQAAKGLLGSGNPARRPFFGLIVQGNGWLGRQEAPVEADCLAGGGFVKSLFLEQPSLLARVIDLAPGLGPARMADLALRELSTGTGFAEAGYTADGTRLEPRLYPVSPPALPARAESLAPGAVVLVSGGAKGITAACVLELARTYGVRLALVGRSEPPLPGQDDELTRNLRRFEEAGLSAAYYTCDITDAAAVRRLVARVEEELGPVEGVVHAAGANTPHRIEHVTEEAFLQVLRPKMLGLVNLLAALNPARLRLLVSFSSIIGHSGMPGNSDYAYANAWLNQVTRRCQAAHPHLQVLTYNFSVWDELGMGARLGSVRALAKMGIGAIPPAEGQAAFRRLLGRQWPSVDLIVTARLEGLNGTLRFAQPGALPGAGFLQRVLRYQPGVELVTEVALKPGEDRYLDEHDYQGALLFPAVAGLEAMVQVATACRALPEAVPLLRPVLEHLAFHRPIVIPRDGRSIRIQAQAEEAEPDGTQRVRVWIRSSATRFEIPHFEGTCVWRAAPPALEHPMPAWPDPLPINVQEELYGSLFFQGPMFQNIAAYRSLSATHCFADVKVPPASPSLPAAFRGGALTGMPQVRDAFLHAVQLCVPEHRILPVSMEQVVLGDFEGGLVHLVARERARTESDFLYDLHVFDEHRRCIEVVRGFRCRIMGPYEHAEPLRRFQQMHAHAARAASTAGIS